MIKGFRQYLTELTNKDFITAVKVGGVIYKGRTGEFHDSILERMPQRHLEAIDAMANPEAAFGFMNITTRKFVPVNDIQIQSDYKSKKDAWQTFHSFHTWDKETKEVRIVPKVGISTKARWNLEAKKATDWKVNEDWYTTNDGVWVSAMMNRQREVVTGPTHGQADHINLMQAKFGKGNVAELDKMIEGGVWDVGAYNHKIDMYVSYNLDDKNIPWAGNGSTNIKPSKVTVLNVANKGRPKSAAATSSNVRRRMLPVAEWKPRHVKEDRNTIHKDRNTIHKDRNTIQEDWIGRHDDRWVSAWLMPNGDIHTGPPDGSIHHFDLTTPISTSLGVNKTKFFERDGVEPVYYNAERNAWTDGSTASAGGRNPSSSKPVKGKVITHKGAGSYPDSNLLRKPSRLAPKKLTEIRVPYSAWGVPKGTRTDWKLKALANKKFWPDGSVSGFSYKGDLYIGKLSDPKKREHIYLIKKLQKMFGLSDDEVETAMERTGDRDTAQLVYYNPLVKKAATLDDAALGYNASNWDKVKPVKFNKLKEV